MRAADDASFREALLADPDAALANTDYSLSEYEIEALAEYRRVAIELDEQHLMAARRYCSPADQDQAAAGM